ncbi:MAG: N-methyl-L-tryptophan oxidase [Parvularculaceae bacterium]|nr:N-methyl-L-tryptophan oxidase [Parvularculaceae bacterium]
MRIAIIGAGLAGASAALALAQAGAQTAVFEQFALRHDKGSSHGPTRLFRTAYFERPDYVPILKRALAGWRRLERAAGETLFHQTGVVEAGPPDGFLMPGLARAVAEHDLPVERLSRAALKRDHRNLVLPEHFDAIFEKDAGFILSDRAHGALLRLARECGARLAPDTRVTRWEPAKDGVAIWTAQGKEIFDRLVIAAGSWANALVGVEAAKIEIAEMSVFWRKPATRDFNLDAGFAPFGVETQDGEFYYGFPAIDGDGVKLGEHTRRSAIASHADRTDAPAPGEEAMIDTFLERFIPALAHRPGAHQRCLYEMSADGDFLIDRHPLCDRVIFLAGLSGHGFKFAPVLGEAIAAMAHGQATPAEWEFLSLRRFAASP